MMPRNAFKSPQTMQGQALAELAVMAALLVPVFLLIPVLAKYGHGEQMARQAARNATWEATVSDGYRSPGIQSLQQRALDRNFADADARILSNASGATTGQFGDQMLNTFSGKKLLERDGLHMTRMSESGSPGYVDNAVKLLPRNYFDSHFPPNSNGYFTSEVKLTYRPLKTTSGTAASYLDPFDKIDIVQTRQQTLLVDAWNASGPRSGRRSVIDTVKPLAPTSYFSGLNGVLDLFKPLSPILPAAGRLGDLEIGSIEPDVVPSDKLAKYPVK